MGSNRLPACAPDNLNQNNNLRSRIETNTSMASRLHATVCQFPPVGKIFRSVDAPVASRWDVTASNSTQKKPGQPARFFFVTIAPSNSA
jgi:hypothetical protein